MHIVYFCSLNWERIAWFWVRSSICRKKNKSCTTWWEGYGGSICTISDEDLLKDAHASEQHDDDNTDNMNSKENHHCSQVKQFGIICLLGCCPQRGKLSKPYKFVNTKRQWKRSASQKQKSSSFCAHGPCFCSLSVLWKERAKKIKPTKLMWLYLSIRYREGEEGEREKRKSSGAFLVTSLSFSRD